jgi:hypothetical protein
MGRSRKRLHRTAQGLTPGQVVSKRRPESGTRCWTGGGIACKQDLASAATFPPSSTFPKLQRTGRADFVLRVTQGQNPGLFCIAARGKFEVLRDKVTIEPHVDSGPRSIDHHDLEITGPVSGINGNSICRSVYFEIDGALANCKTADADSLQRFG